jgi:hypothetical protein
MDPQLVVDQLAERLATPVLLDDRHLVPIAYSRHSGELDEVRVASILRRGAGREAREALLAQGIEHAIGPTRTEPVEALDLRARICVPVRTEHALLGYLWVLDAGFDEAALDLLRDAAADLAGVLDDGSADGWIERAVSALLGPDADAAASAARALRVAGYPLQDARVLVAAKSAGSGASLAEAVAALRRSLDPHRLLDVAVGGQHAVILLRARGHDAPKAALRLHALLAGAADRPRVARAWVGIGAPAPVHADLHRSLRSAQKALLVARREALGDVVDWSELGPLQLLSHVEPGLVDDLTDRLEALRSNEPVLYQTLECYLDAAGDAQAAAERLDVHRGTLYNRLKRAEAATATSLADGLDRLWLHAAIKVRLVVDAD